MLSNPSMQGPPGLFHRKRQQEKAKNLTQNKDAEASESKPLLLPIKPNHCRQPTMKLPGSANGNFASTLRNGSAPPRKIMNVNKGSVGPIVFGNTSADSNTTAADSTN